ncbi:MAG: hypothetical protein GY749_43020 [Desulfobacteraceae bacterium]|nr:hypothetical protein [Desulfobacteraceae bacterium]
MLIITGNRLFYISSTIIADHCYITVWAPRQAGKTWIMQQVMRKIKAHGDFELGIITMQSAKNTKTEEGL